MILANKKHKLSERGDDLYETPREAVDALLAARPDLLGRKIWEPACGPGAIVRVLREAGACVLGTDLVDYESPYQTAFNEDFLLRTGEAHSYNCIITNPPYKLAREFVSKALELKIKDTFMLLRLAFLESARRTDILDGGHLAHVYVFKSRLPMMHRHGWQGPKSTSNVPYAWFHWTAQKVNVTTISRI